jgi:hypothetical protein
MLLVLEPPISPVPPGNFQGYDFLKAYEKCYKMSLVCTLVVGALRIYWVKSLDFIKKIAKRWKNCIIKTLVLYIITHFLIIHIINIHDR